MKIEISNFGPLRSFCFDTSKNLHLIVGENNIGKSYGITLSYLTLKSLIYADEYSRYGFRTVDSSDFHPVPPSVEKLIASSEVDVTDYVKDLIKSFFESFFLDFLNGSFIGTFEKPELTKNIRTDEEFCLSLKAKELTVRIGMSEDGLFVSGVDLRHEFVARKIRTHRSLRRNGTKIVIYVKEGDDERQNLRALSIAANQFVGSFYRDATKDVRSVHFLPASRSGLYQALNAFGQIIAELSKSRSFLSSKIELPGISEPLSDYFLRLSEIRPAQRDTDDVFEKIAVRMEDSILKGKVGFDKKTKVITYSPKGSRLELELSSASSMVSELSPIVSYIRYILPLDARFPSTLFRSTGLRKRRTPRPGSKTLVFIEEPEAHLHPAVQVQLVLVFCELLDADVNLAITTHSNYLFNEFSNKLISSKISPESVFATQLVSGESGSTQQLLESDELGIEDKNFGKVSEEILNERIEALNKKNVTLKQD